MRCADIAVSPQGIDIMGISQFSGCPVIAEWGIIDAQYPSVSMTNWTTGSGNARCACAATSCDLRVTSACAVSRRYWVLRLLLDNFEAGDNLVETGMSGSQLFAQVTMPTCMSQRHRP